MEHNITLENGLPRSRHCRFTPDRYIELRPHGEDIAYDIALARLEEPNGLAEWIRQITSKSWATPEVLADFAAFASSLILCPPPATA